MYNLIALINSHHLNNANIWKLITFNVVIKIKTNKQKLIFFHLLSKMPPVQRSNICRRPPCYKAKYNLTSLKPPTLYDVDLINLGTTWHLLWVHNENPDWIAAWIDINTLSDAHPEFLTLSEFYRWLFLLTRSRRRPSSNLPHGVTRDVWHHHVPLIVVYILSK